jgi:hypothetical protein
MNDNNAVLLLENNGGSGQYCSHWEHDLFATNTQSELMTAWFQANLEQPISRVSCAALDDLEAGFVIDYSQCDAWSPNSRRLQGPPGLDGKGPPGLGGKTPRGWEVAKTKTSFDLSTLMEDIPALESDISSNNDFIKDIFGARRKNLRG